MTFSINEILSGLDAILGDRRLDAPSRALLGQGMLYYCSGKDPTPIAALGADVPLYVYVDRFGGTDGDFSAARDELYKRLGRLGFSFRGQNEVLKEGRLKTFRNAEATLWEENGKGHFALLVLQGDASIGYEQLYRDGENHLQPTYVCNYRNELSRPDLIAQLEKRVQYIMGHCHSEKYREIACYDYLGDYGNSEKVSLYKRLYYYLF